MNDSPLPTLSSDQVLALAQNPGFCAQLLALSPVLTAQIKKQTSDLVNSHLQSGADFDGRQVEVDVDEATLNTLFSVIAEQWRHLGATKPHFSVLSIDEWSPANIAAPGKLAEFYNTGVTEVNEFIKLCQRNSVGFGPDTHCLELGCGVGRVTVHLAKLFKKVTGLDISAGNLAEAKRTFLALNVGNAMTRQIESPDEFTKLGAFEVLFSRMVLQHNPPPIQAFILNHLLRQLAPGGIGFFQTITGGGNYRYNIRSHLAQHRVTDFELHALPMNKVLAIIRATGCHLLDVYRDLAGGYNVESYTFLVRKT
ncbi:MAG: class I SAM-dependent methyltransferase [Rhodocyclaceae bacterium]|nr:class I SAM-dependent methyltransferase [Rhodocyclaceae bacterium]